MDKIIDKIMEIISIHKIRPNIGQIDGLPANPRKIDDDKLQRLKKSIQDYPEMLGYRSLMVYPLDNGFYVIIGGNMRYKACVELGMTELPCVVIDKKTPVEKLRAFTILDNNEFGEWDMEMLAKEWNTQDLENWGMDIDDLQIAVPEKQKEIVEDDFDEEKVTKTICKPGDIWQIGMHRLMCGDSTDKSAVEKLMAGEMADLYLTDPPYNVNVTNSQGMKIANDNMRSSNFYKFLHDAFNAVVPFMKSLCPFYVWFASCEHINFESALNSVGLKVRQEIIWNKNMFVLGRSDYQYKHEPCLYGWKDGDGNGKHYFIEKRNETTVIPDADEIDIDRLKKDEMNKLLHKIFDSNIPTTVINENKPQKNTDHPTMKPVRLFARLITNSSREGDIVLDTFGGSGTTIIACEQTNRNARIMELDQHYCDVIIARWENFTGGKAKLLNKK